MLKLTFLLPFALLAGVSSFGTSGITFQGIVAQMRESLQNCESMPDFRIKMAQALTDDLESFADGVGSASESALNVIANFIEKERKAMIYRLENVDLRSNRVVTTKLRIEQYDAIKTIMNELPESARKHGKVPQVLRTQVSQIFTGESLEDDTVWEVITSDKPMDTIKEIEQRRSDTLDERCKGR